MTDPDLASPPAVIRRVAFLGTPPAAVPSLMALVEAGYDVPLVISRPDRRRGRGSKLIPSPVKQAARDLGLPVDDQPESLLSVEALDLAVVVAYGRILSRPLLERLPMVNVHFSLLPRWRGAAPVERAILAGDDVTGVSIIALSEGLDEGPVYDRLEVAVGPDETAAELTARLADTGADLLISVMRRGLSDPFPQQGEVTYAAKLDRSEYELDFGLRAADVHRRVRVGRAWTTFR
ncbi:MAG: formyltransferase family protein, partial [Acidimicrobiia bacterium]|nr:formyltransferase family protein [Acidimicrobiia bacterium]